MSPSVAAWKISQVKWNLVNDYTGYRKSLPTEYYFKHLSKREVTKFFFHSHLSGCREGSYIEGRERKSLCQNKGRRKEDTYSVTLEGKKGFTVF